MTDAIVSIRNVSKRFGQATALTDVSIDIQQGEIFALLGPSGCGKSTLLRIVSGFESPDDGELLLDGQDMTRLPPNKRPINMVFQSYAVFPHMSVRDNVAYGLKMDRVPVSEIAQRVTTVLDQVHLADFADRMPDQLSGGQRQRVALARALVKRPRVLLLDEPLSALDAKLRDAMRLELVKLQETVGITFVIVTHDQAEAMAMADRIAVLESGRLRQVATPADLYEHPCDAFVADFIGNIHTFPVHRIETDQGTVLHTEQLGAVAWSDRQLPNGVSAGTQATPNPVLAIRPEHIRISRTSLNHPAPDASTEFGLAVGEIAVQGSLGDVAFQGQYSVVEMPMSGGHSVTAIIDNASARELMALKSGESITATWRVSDMLLLPHDASLSRSA